MEEERRDDLPWRLDPETKAIVRRDGRLPDQEFWLSRPPAERWRALELLRRALYGEAATAPMRKMIIEVGTVDWG